MKFTITLFLSFFTAGLLAQPTLTSANLPSVGDSYTVFTETSLPAGSTQGSSGQNVYWDFSSLSSTGGDALEFFANTGVTYPNSNLYFETQGTENYFDVTSGALTFHGFASSGADAVYTDGQDQVRVPMNYNDQYTDTYAGSFSAFTTTYSRTGDLTVTMDGYGTLETPQGVYQNVMRFQIIRESTDYDNGTAVSTQLDSIYFWYNEYTPHPLMTYSINYVNGSETGRFANYISDGDVTVSLNEEKNLTSVKVFPNPSSEELNISADEVIEEVEIRSITGKLILKSEFSSEKVKLDVSKLKTGTYFYSVETANGNHINKSFVKN